jgi:hypothetical protein
VQSEQRKINERQTEVLALQAAELRESLAERKRAAEEQRKAQAPRVFIWLGPVEEGPEMKSWSFGMPDIVAHAVNKSDQPVYDAELHWHSRSEPHCEPDPEPLGVIMPGETIDKEGDSKEDTNMAVSGAFLRFRDAAGVIWTRAPDGELTEEQQNDPHQPPHASSSAAEPDLPH